jgi:pimeloyl-ACP methyl ester carboxylesterase
MRRVFTQWSLLLPVCASGVLILGCAPTPDTRDEAAAFYERTRTTWTEINRTRGAIHEGGTVPLHYLRWGDRDGVPLVYLHGTYGSAHEIVPFAERLTAAGYRLVSVDWYGHGKTPVPDRDVSIRDLAPDLRGLLDDLEIDAAAIAGHSRGGMIATAFYERFPERVLGMILADGGSVSVKQFFDELGDEELGAWLEEWVAPETDEIRSPTYADERALFSDLWQQLGRPTDPMELTWVLAQAGPREDGRWVMMRESTPRWLEQDTFAGAWRGAREPAQGPPFMADCTLLEPRAVFAELDVPVLVLDATGDRMAWTEQNRLLAADHPELVRLVEYEAGHYLFREEPERFVADVIGFKERLGTK